MHDVSNFASSCRVADMCEMFHGRSVHIMRCIVHLFFGHYYLECVHCSAGIIRSIDTISNIYKLERWNVSHEVDWFITSTS